MKAIIYRRVSTDTQAERGVSLEAQLDKMRAYCALHDLEVVAEIADPGESAKSLNRPGIRQAVAMLRNQEADCLVIYKLDRLTRRLADWTYLVENLFNEKGAALMSVTDSIDTRTAAGRMVLNMIVTVAQWERETISERVRTAMQHKKANGATFGGKRTAQPANKWQPTPEDEAVVLEVLRANPGASLRTLADALNARGVQRQAVAVKEERGLRTKPGKWHAATVARFLKDRNTACTPAL